LILSWAINYLYFSLTQVWGTDTNSFFFKSFLKTTSGPFSLGGIVWPVFIGITIIWLLNWFICYKGVSGGIEKVNKVLLPALVIIMIIIVIRGITLPGASLGLNKLFTPDWSKVLDAKVWIAAYGQVFFSLSLAMGIMITYSSYLPKKTDINNTALITAFANSGFEFLSAIGVFAILGYMATSQGVGIDKVASQGIGLAFVAFPKVFTVMGGIGKLFGVLFFTCLVFAGLTSSISLVEASSSAIIDKSGKSRKKIVTLVCSAGYLISIVYSTGAGLYFLDIIDSFINSYGIVTVGLLEAITIGWLFGSHKIREHTNAISYYPIGKWWDVMIKFVTPAILIYMIAQNLIHDLSKPYGGYSTTALIIFGWGVIIIGIVFSIILTKTSWHEGSLSMESDKNTEVK